MIEISSDVYFECMDLVNEIHSNSKSKSIFGENLWFLSNITDELGYYKIKLFNESNTNEEIVISVKHDVLYNDSIRKHFIDQTLESNLHLSITKQIKE